MIAHKNYFFFNFGQNYLVYVEGKYIVVNIVHELKNRKNGNESKKINVIHLPQFQVNSSLFCFVFLIELFLVVFVRFSSLCQTVSVVLCL